MSNAREYAMSLLSRRAYSRNGLYEKLICREIEPEQAMLAVEWLAEIGYLDDENYTLQVIQSQKARGYGKMRIFRYLSAHGIDADFSREVWDKQDGQEDVGAIDRAIKKIYKGKPLDRKETKRIADSLFRRGFSWDEIRRVLKTLGENDDLGEWS